MVYDWFIDVKLYHELIQDAIEQRPAVLVTCRHLQQHLTAGYYVMLSGLLVQRFIDELHADCLINL